MDFSVVASDLSCLKTLSYITVTHMLSSSAFSFFNAYYTVIFSLSLSMRHTMSIAARFMASALAAPIIQSAGPDELMSRRDLGKDGGYGDPLTPSMTNWYGNY